MAGGPIDLWNKWAIQILVLLSFTCQVVLLLFAGIRRHEAYHVFRPLLWLAYQLADSTAIYALGHLSLSSAPRDQQLFAFWAPFLVLHLGGPDNITAYTLEDNQLWQRHLLTLVVQVLGAAYVLYKHITGSGDLVLAAMLMFAVGVAKYAERTWALKCSNIDSIRSSLKKQSRAMTDRDTHPKGAKGEFDEQVLLEVGHSLFHFCKLKLVDSSVNMDGYDGPRLKYYDFEWNDTWKLIEMELSLIYDILYTKAAVIHTWFGYCIRFVSPLATAAAFLLFHFHLSNGLHGQSGVDIAITYALLAGALFMEVAALLSAIGSTWTLAFLCDLPMRWSWIRHALVCTGRWHRLRRLLLSLGWLDIRRRRWSGTVGQYNLLHFCTRDSSNLLGRLAELLGLEERWNKFHYSGSLVISEDDKKSVFDGCKLLMSNPGNVNALGLLRAKWGDLPLKKHELEDGVRKRVTGVELQEDIIIWHIATDVFLAKRDNGAVVRDDVVRRITVLSNYMMFLLVKRPYLLPGLVLHRVYDLACDNLVQIWDSRRASIPISDENIFKKLFSLHDKPVSSSSRFSQRKELANIVYDVNQHKEHDFFSRSDYRIKYAADVAAILLDKEKEGTDMLDAVLDVWMDLLFYVANKCNRESYAKKLGSGCELTAILWLTGAHFQPRNRSS